MRQVLHLLIVDPSREAALAACVGSKWLLPVLVGAERVRAEPAILRWVSERGIPSDLAGQWLGYVGPQATDWLVVLRAKGAPSPEGSTLEWRPLRSFAPVPPVIWYQGWAVATSLQRGSLPCVAGPFGNLAWVDAIVNWIGGVIGSKPCALTPYRVSAHEVVLGAATATAPVYFKGLTTGRAAEMRLTKALAALAPDAFARTIANEERRDGSVWWLTAGCPGAPGGEAAPVAQALARLQRRVMGSASVLRELQRVDVEGATRWACSFVEEHRVAEAIRGHARMVVEADVPESWIPMDLDPTNVLVDMSGTVRFIDLDGSCLGPAPLAMATFAKRCRSTSLYRVYEEAWHPPLTDVPWHSFEVVAAVLDASHGWERVEQNTRRGEVHGALGLVAGRIRDRLAGAVHRR